MSEISYDSITNLVKTCLCGEIAYRFTLKTSYNPKIDDKDIHIPKYNR